MDLNGVVYTSANPVRLITPTPSLSDLERELAAARAENIRLKSRKTTFKVTDKGDVSIYLVGSRFPVTLPFDKLEAILIAADDTKAFIAANRTELDRIAAAKGKK